MSFLESSFPSWYHESTMKFMNWRLFVFCLLFIISRIWVLQHPPATYSDVSHDYERYANQWRYGLTPYRQIMFEYPPAAIPLLAFPLEMDQRGIGKYYQNYRVQAFTLEMLMFAAIVYGISKSESIHKTKDLRMWAALSFYIAAGIIGKDFWYEGLDLVFFGSLSIGLAMMLAEESHAFLKRVGIWMMLWLSVAIKIMTLPLALPLFLTRTLSLKKELLACCVGGLLIWGVPIVLYRSSMAVFVVFHANRPMKYGAFGTYIIESINDYTKTEYRLMEGPDFPMVGPLSNKIAKASAVGFPIAVVIFLIYTIAQSKHFPTGKIGRHARFEYMVRMSLIYVLIQFLTGKTFSSPFHIWYVPLLVIYPFKYFSKQIFTYALALLMITMDTTLLIQVPKDVVAFGLTPWTRIRDAFRFIPMMIMVWIFGRVQGVKHG